LLLCAILQVNDPQLKIHTSDNNKVTKSNKKVEAKQLKSLKSGINMYHMTEEM